MLSIRQAEEKDADALSELLCASIRALCTADHKGNADLIAQWTANKTPAHLTRWIGDPRVTLFLAERGGQPAGVGCISEDGEVQLNYVAPAHRFSGISRAMLAHLEAALRQRGVRKARLSSTETARRFYREAGWVDSGEPQTMFGIRNHPMEKQL